MPIDTTIIPPEKNIIQSVLGPITPASLTEIITQFNRENDSTSSRSSILKKLNFSGFSLFKHSMLATDQVRLVQRNGVAELAGHSGHFQRRIKIWSLWKPWTWFRVFRDDSSTIGIYSIEQIINRDHIGYGDRHLVVVNSTDYAKVTLDGKTVLLDEGSRF